MFIWRNLRSFSFIAVVLCGVVVAQPSVIYVVARDGQIRAIDGSGNATTVVSGVGNAADLAIDANGNFFVTEYLQGIVAEATPGGAVSTFWTYPQVDSLRSAAFDSSGNLYVAYTGDNGPVNSGTIYEITQSGAVSTYYSGLYSPHGLVFDGLNNLYLITNVNTINKITPSKSISTFATVPQNSDPYDLAFDAHGNLYASDSGDGAISKIAPNGTVSQFASGVTGTEGLAFDTGGILYTDDTYNGTIYSIDQNGNVSNFSSIGNVGATGMAVAAPEPSAFVLSGFLIGALLASRRFHCKAA